MRRRTETISPGGQIIAYKLDPGVFVVDIPKVGRKISLGQPPDAVKRFQQVGFAAQNGVTTFLVVDSKLQGDSICWVLAEFPVLYALYAIQVEVNGKMIPAFFAGKRPMIVGLQNDVEKALAMVKYGNYGIDRIEDLDGLDIPEATRDALKKEILGLAVGNEIKESTSFVDAVQLDPNPKDEGEFSDIGDGIRVGRIGYNTYRFVYGKDAIDVDVTLLPDEKYRSPVEYKHLKFPVMNFGIWHTGEFDGFDPYYSCEHTSIIHKYEAILIDYPSSMTDIINHNGLSKQSVNTVFVTHNHDDHVGAMVELFRRSHRCHIVTTEPVKFSMIKKLSTLVDLPEKMVEESFAWTILPFREDNPYQTESLNYDGIQVTGHLSCHSVPTTVYTFQFNNEGHIYTYGHFMDIVAFKRMEQLVKDGWMPEKHLSHLNRIVRETRYSLIKYDVGCINDAGLPFAVHHANRDALDPAYQQEGRFVSIGDLDSSVRSPDGTVIRLGADKTAITAFFMRSYQAVFAYFESLLGGQTSYEISKLMLHYATAFANCPKQPDPNIGAFLFEQGADSRNVLIIIRGQAEIQEVNSEGEMVFRSTVGDGEVLGDVGVIAGKPRRASIRSLNRLSYLAVPASLFLEAMGALGIVYEGFFKELFERRMFFQAATGISQDVSTIVLNRIAKVSATSRVKKGDQLFRQGEKDDRLIITGGEVELRVGDRSEVVPGPNIIGECEFFLGNREGPAARLISAQAKQAMEVLTLDAGEVRDVPVIMDNIRHVLRARCQTIYQGLSQTELGIS